MNTFSRERNDDSLFDQFIKKLDAVTLTQMRKAIRNAGYVALVLALLLSVGALITVLLASAYSSGQVNVMRSIAGVNAGLTSGVTASIGDNSSSIGRTNVSDSSLLGETANVSDGLLSGERTSGFLAIETASVSDDLLSGETIEIVSLAPEAACALDIGWKTVGLLVWRWRFTLLRSCSS